MAAVDVGVIGGGYSIGHGGVVVVFGERGFRTRLNDKMLWD